MSNYSSRMYGIKVKEKINYFEFGTSNSGGYITISYNDGLWVIKAGKNSGEAPENVEWWMNGVQFQNGDVIASFNDGDVVTYTIMEMHKDTIPYVNYFYDVFGGSAENINYGTKDIYYRIIPWDSAGRSIKTCKVYEYEDNLIASNKTISNSEIVASKSITGEPMKVYNMLFDWDGENFKAISNSNYIKYNGTPKGKGTVIRTFNPDDFEEFEVVDETNKHTAKEVGKDALPKINLCKRKGGKNVTTTTLDRELIYSEILHDHVDAYYNGNYHNAMYLVWDTTGASGCWKKIIKNALAMTYADPYWFLVTTKDGVEYNGTTYKAKKLIRCWKPETVVNMTLKMQNTRKLEKPKEGNYDKFIYDVLEEDGIDSCTVKYQQVITTKDEQGHSHTQYVDLDSVTFTSADADVSFHNIQFKCKNGKWTIYSKCGFISFDGRTYLKGKSILSFYVAEGIHIHINDDSNKYYVESTTIWNIRTGDSSVTTDYEIHTSSSKSLKVVKTTGEDEEPWVTVYFYDAIYEAFEVDDISFKYDKKKATWELFSNSDGLYYNGVNRKVGDSLKVWSYYESVKINGISATHTDTDSIRVEKRITSNGSMIKNQDIDEDIDWYDDEEPDFHLSYSYSKNLWVITALRECWMSGQSYPTGSTVTKFKSRTSVPSFTIMFPHEDDGVIENVLYTFEVTSSVQGVTNVLIDSHGYGEHSYNDKDINNNAKEVLTFTTKDAKSMYGYIWKKWGGPTPPVPSIFDFLFSQSYGYNGGSYYNTSRIALLDVTTTSLSEEYHLNTYGNVYLYKLLPGKQSFSNRIFALMASEYDGDYSQLLFISDDFGKSWKPLRENGVDPPYTYIQGNRTYGFHICSRNKMYQKIDNRFIKYTIMDNGNLVKESDTIIELPSEITLTDSVHRYYDVNNDDSTGFTDTYKTKAGYYVSGEPGWYDGYCWYDLDNQTIISTVRDYLLAYTNELNDTYASYRYDPVTWRTGDKYWTYFANMRFYWNEENDSWTEVTDDRPGSTDELYLNHVQNMKEIHAGEYLFLYFRIACYEKWNKISDPPSSGENITERMAFAIRYNVNTGELILLDISDESWKTMFHPGSSGYDTESIGLKYFNGEYYSYKQCGSKFQVLKFDVSTGTASVVKEYDEGQSILVKYFNRSSSWSNDYIRIYFLSGAQYPYGVRQVSTNLYECQIDPGTVLLGFAMNELNVPRWINGDNFEGSGSGYNKRLTFKKMHYNSNDGSGVIFVFDNPLLESRLSFGFRDDYFY